MAYGASGTVDTGSPPACRVYNSTGPSIGTGGGLTVLTFDTNRFDPTGMHSTVTNTSRITIASPGVYLFTGYCYWANNATGVRRIELRLNGATFIGSQDVYPNSSDAGITNVSSLWKCAANDYVEMGVYQTSGGALSIVASASRSPEFSAMWMGLGT